MRSLNSSRTCWKRQGISSDLMFCAGGPVSDRASLLGRRDDRAAMAVATAGHQGRQGETGGFWAWMMAPERRGPYLVAPAIIVLFVMNIFPLLWSFGLSFFNFRANKLTVPEFRGLFYYEKVLTDDKVWERFQTTAIIVGSSVLLQLIIGFLLALMFATRLSAPPHSSDAGAHPDDAVLRVRGRLLQTLLRADIRLGQLGDQPIYR